MHTIHRRWSRRLLILAALVAFVAVVAATPARAAETRGGDNIVIGHDEVVNGDLYVAGNTVTVDGTINGDLVAFASQVTINGTINGDLLAGAQAVIVNGTVSDDVRALGQAIVLSPGARSGGDLAALALSLESQTDSAVDGDVLVGAYQALLSGTVGKNVRGGLDRLELRGTVGGDVNVAVSGDQQYSAIRISPAGQVPIPVVQPNLTVANSARIGGKLTYRSTAPASVSQSAQVTHGIAFDQQPASSAPAAEWPALGYARQLAGLLLAGLLLIWLLPRWTSGLADTVERRPLPSLGWGLVAFFAFLATVIAIVTLTIALAILFGYLTLGGLVGMIITLGLLAGATLVAGYITFAGYVAQAIVGYMAGRWLLRQVQPAWAERPWIPLIAGLVLYVALRAIPWLGALVGLLVVLLALGGLWQWGRATLQRPRATPSAISGLQPA